MGMDQSLVTTTTPTPGESLRSEPEGWYWRKNYHLMEFFARAGNFVDHDNQGDFDHETLEITAEMLDELEKALTTTGLPSPQNGGWFRSSWVDPSFLERTSEKTAYDLEAVQWAKARLTAGEHVYYLVYC